MPQSDGINGGSGGRFDNAGLQQWTSQGQNPAAPEGMQQAATAAKGYEQAQSKGGGRFDNSGLGQWTSTNGYTATAPSWYTGFNAEGTNNGWDTTFTEKFVSGWNAAQKDGTAASYFEDGGTGVVTWDHKSSDGLSTFKFGDIVEDGKVVGNTFDLYGKDGHPEDANLAMLPWLDIDGTAQGRIFADSDRIGKLDQFVKSMHESNNDNAARALTAADFQGDVKETQENLQAGWGDELLAGLGGAAGGAVTGAGTGAALTAWAGPGALVGGLVGGAVGSAVGAVGGLMNKDEIAEQAARGYEVTQLSLEDNGTAAGIATGVKEAAGFSMKLTSPLQNVVHGALDAGKGDVGDGESEFYRTDDKGENQAPVWAKVASLSAAVGDGLLQFSSPAARILYTGQMGGVIGGEVGELGLSGGKMFDPREGRFDNIFVDDDGNFDPASASAGILKIGIDAVQLAGWRGLARQTVAGREAAEAGMRPVEMAGHRFVLNEAGEAVAAKKTLTLLAPSEQIAYWGAARQARVAVLRDPSRTVVTADDFYRAASSLSNGSRTLKAAMLNGFGEGYEETAQAILEPIALDGDIRFGDVANAFFYGTAAGVGMSLGATFGGASQDAKLSAQAYTIETIRRGEEPVKAEWDAAWKGFSDTEKRVMASRSSHDAALTRSALDQIVKDQAATMVASEVDAVKAIDARRAMRERDLNKATIRTDEFHVMAGLLDAGQVSSTGELLGDTAPAEAVVAGAATIHRMLDNRLRGLGLQASTLQDRINALSDTDAAADPNVAAKVAEAQALLAHVDLMGQFGANLVADVQQMIDRIYDEETTEEEGEQYVRALNGLLSQVFNRTASLVAPEGSTAGADELADAAAQFVSVLHSREPKLDTGSYLALLPRASWELTRTGSEDFVQVNTDILQAINGDFDGDKLRAEHQLILSRERFLQARAGQFFGGAGPVLDIGVRNFDEALAAAVGSSLEGEGQLRDEAQGVLRNIDTAITNRYGRMMSPDALARVLEEFHTAVRAGSEEARVTLLNALAREAGEAITNHGRETLTNEWLWASKVVRANLQAFQTTYRQLRSTSAGPSETVDVEDFNTPEGTNRRKDRAVTDAQTLALFAVGNTLFRKFQKIHYTFFNASVLEAANAEQSDLYDIARTYEELGRGVTRAELARVTTNDTVAGRVLVMLSRLVDDALADPELKGRFDPDAAMSVLANVKVKDVWWDKGQPVTDGKDLSLAQLLLKRALDADREEHAKTFDTDEKLKAKHSRLRALTVPNDVAGDVNAEKAFLEIFGAVPFADSLGGAVGALAPHTTPEQWLRNYESLDAHGRREMERLFTNVPEYLDRAESTNIPYSMAEASNREISSYRSMMDAMLAVGRARLTFDPTKPADKAFGGDKAKASKQAQADFTEGHRLVQQAMLDFRKATNRRDKNRPLTAELAQQLLEANPQFGRQVMGLIPDAAANAVFEYRDGQLYIAPWVYEMFAIKNSDEALFYYWKNLTLAQWNSTQLNMREDDTAAGRAYNRLQSRFQRLLYQLAKEPGQPHLELVIRQMHGMNNLDEFFLWLNTQPGIRGQQAVLLPFNDDVADFEADAGGGWVTIKSGTELRQAIAAMRQGAEQLRSTMAFREQKAATDRSILNGIKQARAGDPAATPTAHENLRKLGKAVSMSRELPRGFAPSAMLALTQGALRGLDAQSHDKGRTATSYMGLGEMQALMDAFAFVPGLERVMETLTAHSIGSLRTNVGDIAKHSGVAMDANGRQIEWDALTVDQVIEMLDDSRTAPLAHLLLTPTALDLTPSGTLTERLLMEASLKDLLDDDHYKDLFSDDILNLDQALRYLSLVDSRGRTEGGGFDAIRAANDRAIAMTSGLGRVATEDDLARLRDQAYLDVARMLQMVARIQASPDARDAGMLEQLRRYATEELRQQRMSRALPGFTNPDTGDVVVEWVDKVLAELGHEHETLKQALLDMYEGDELTRQTEVLAEQYQRNEDRIRDVLSDDTTGQLVHRFRVTGDDILDRAAHAQIVEYVRSMASFPTRAPESAQAWSKLANQLQQGSTPTLSTTEWETLSHSAMGVYLADQVLRVASHVSLPPFPKGDPATSDARFYKYFDPSFSFLVTDLLQEDSPMTAAAVWLHQAAERPTNPPPLDQLKRTLRETVLNRQQLGAWTPGLMSQIVEAHQRMDSAAAGQAIAAAGNGPKRWAAIAHATRRTAKVPGPELLTTVPLPGDLLVSESGISRSAELIVTPAGAGESVMMPIAQLDNRFASAVRINGTEVPLAANLGFEWSGAEEASPYRYIALDRLAAVVDRYAKQQGLDPADLVVELDILHPDSQPAGPEWMNNTYFEGMSHSLLPDGAESLVATLWSDNGGMISADTQRPLDAGKKGLRAIEPFQRLDDDAVAEAENLWSAGHDFAGMLRRKTQLIMGHQDLDGAYFNALYKHMKLHHIVAGVRDGKPAAMTAEEVIAFQAANGRSAPLPLTGAKLVTLSPDVLRTMLGETGDQGVARFFDDDYLLDPDLATPYEGISERMLARFGAGWVAQSGSVADTALANVGQQRVLTVRTMLTDKERNARQDRVIYLNNRSNEARTARHQKLDKAEVRKGFLAAVQLATGSVLTERSTFAFGAVNAGMIAPRNVIESEHTARLLEGYQRAQGDDSFERGWVVSDEGGPYYPGGVLTVDSLTEDRAPEHHVVKGDLAVVQLDTFERPERDITQVHNRVEKAMRYLANSGANVLLGPGNGGGDLRFHAAQYLKSLGYAPIAGSRHLYGPVEFVFQTQNERAYESTLAETKRIRPARNAITFLAIDPIGTDENMAILNPASAKLRDRKAMNNIVPSSTFPNYNLPVEDNRDNGLYARALQHLRSQLDPTNTEAREALLAMAGPDPAGVMPIKEALDRFHATISNRASLVPEVGDTIREGDILPFVHPDGKVLLYRHGFKLPRDEAELTGQLKTGGMNVALAKSETESAATTNDGTIASVENRAGYGRTLLLESALQPYGNKLQLEWNGMKYVVVPPSSGFVMPPVFGNGSVVDLFSDAASADSKEAFEGRAVGYRNALAFYQFDFTDDLVKFFFPNENTRDPQARVLTYDLLHRLANQDDARIPFTDANAIAKANVAVADLLAQFAAAEAERSNVPADWTGRLQSDNDASAQIARAVILYLLTPNAHVDNVLKSGGFSQPRAGEDDARTRLVPGLFADLLDNGLDSAVHAELIDRFDAQLYRGPDGSGFKLHTDWTVEMFDGKGGSIRGYLQFGEAHSSGDNPVTDGQAFDGTEKSGVSPHNLMASASSVGAITAHSVLKKSRAFAKSFTRGGPVSKLGTDGDSMWQMLTALPNEKDSSLVGWRRETPAETVRRALAREELVGFYHPLNTDRWSEEERLTYQREALKVLNHLNLYGSQVAMVDTWVRDHLGRPHAIDGSNVEQGVINAADAIETVAEILKSVRSGLLPHVGAGSPLIDVNHLTTMYLANLHRENGWAPVDPATGAKATTWDAWVESAFGVAFNGEKHEFDQVYLLAVDGRMHGYQGATTSTRYLPVSADLLRQRQLMDPETNRMLVSIAADENLLATDPTLFNTARAELEEIIGGQRIYGAGRNGPDPASAKGKQKARLERWRREVEAPRQANKRMRGVRGPGQTFLGHTTTTSAFFRSMMNLRVGNVLFNVALMVSAPVEAFYRRTINTFANVAVGESTGAIGQAQARIADRFADTSLGTVAEALGLRPAYTGAQLKQLNKLVDALASRSDFKAMVYKELMFQYPSMPGIGKFEKVLERYAKFGGRLQDPAWGMLPKDLARIYVETAMRRISSDPTGENVYSVEMLQTQLARNPQWLFVEDLETHNMAIAAISQIRSLKPNVVSLGFRGLIDPLAENDKFLVNATGNMLKILTAFQGFWSNYAISIAGLQGPADFMAFWFDGREKKITARMQAALRGETYNPEEAEHFDMSEVLESMDLADSFIRGGVTHAGLFALGMLAGGLGLSGDDDEMKWRRRQAELQGVPVIRDPRDMVNDFRNKDSIYLNWLPMGLDSLFQKNPDNPMQMNWVTRSLLSPIIGFERFYETGDFSEVIFGFKDAIGSHPIANATLWNAATDTVAELHAAASDATEAGDEVAGANFLVQAVGVLERMMLENSMMNMIYIGHDRYDRDPYAQPKLDSDQNPQGDVRGNPYQTDALQTFVNEDGEQQQGYVKRDEFGATVRSFTENRLGLALLGSVYSGVTGGGFTGSDMFRENMPVKVRKVELQPKSQDEVENILATGFMGAGAQAMLTESEAAQIIKREYEARGVWWDADTVEKQAKVMAANSGATGLSLLDENGREKLTKAGARAVFEGLHKGGVALGAASLNGVFIEGPMRDEIRDEWMKELVQEGVDLNLTKDQATWRMRRIMFGTGTEAGTPKLIDLIYTDKLPWSDTLEYNQLNTTYVTGPNGFPMATGFVRDGIGGALGLKPAKALWTSDQLGQDSRGNAVDGVAGINTGLRALEPRPESWEIPSVEDEIRKAAEKVADAIAELDFSPTPAYAKTSDGSGWVDFGNGGYGGWGSGGWGGGGWGSGGSSFFNKMYALPGGMTPYGNSVPFINTSNPIIRRADVRRERIWSERGRLKQWQ